MIRTTVIALALLLAACASGTTTNHPLVWDGQGPSPWPAATAPAAPSGAVRTARAWKAGALEVSRASGVATCILDGPGPFMAILIDSPDGWRSRHITAITADDLYPGSTVYLSVDGERFSGEERINLNQDLLTALNGGREAWISWSPWPRGVQLEESGTLAGFAAAYDECEAKLASHAG